MTTKIHFPRNTKNFAAAQERGLMAVIAQPAACGQRPNARGAVEITTNPADVTCEKCRVSSITVATEPTIVEQMRAADARGDLEEVVRLAKLL